MLQQYLKFLKKGIKLLWEKDIHRCVKTDKIGKFHCISCAPNYSVWHINLAFCPVLIYHWWFTGRTLGVNISLIRFSWQVCLVYSTIYHIHLQHDIMRHNKQSQPSFDYFRVEEKYISDGWKTCPVQQWEPCLFSVLARFEWNTIKWVWNQKDWHMAGFFIASLGGLSLFWLFRRHVSLKCLAVFFFFFFIL